MFTTTSRSQRSSRLITSLVYLLSFLGTSLAAPPANDNFASATNIASLPYTVTTTTVEATRQTDEPDASSIGSGSIWWRWTASATGWVEFSSQDSALQPEIVLYQGTTLTALTQVAIGSYDALRGFARIRFLATSGVAYRIQLQGLSDAAAAVKFSARTIPAPVQPALTSLSIPTGSANVTAAEATVRLALGFTAPERLISGTVKLTKSTLDTLETSFGETDITTGTSEIGTLAVDLVLPRGRPSGAWLITITLTDEVGLISTYGVGQLAFPTGAPTAVTVVNTGSQDLALPVLKTSSISPTGTITVSTARKEVTLSVNASDDVGVDSLTVEILTPDESNIFRFIELGSADRISGNALDGVYRRTIAFPRYLPPGDYKLNYTITDASARVVSYGTATDSLAIPTAALSKVTVANTGTVDMSPPALTTATTTPVLLQAAALPQTIQFSIVATDDVGIDTIRATLSQRTAAPGAPFPVDVTLTRTAGTNKNGTWTGSRNLPIGTLPSNYDISIIVKGLNEIERTFIGTENEDALPMGSALEVEIRSDAYSMWRADYPSLTSAAGVQNADPDLDGYTNALEFYFGTDPTNFTDSTSPSIPTITPVGGNIIYSYFKDEQAIIRGNGTTLQFVPQRSTNLSTWADITPPPVADPDTGALHITLPTAANPRVFLRLQVR